MRGSDHSCATPHPTNLTMTARKFPFRTELRTPDGLQPLAELTRELPELRRLCSRKLTRAEAFNFIESIDDRIAIACLTPEVGLFGHESHHLVGLQLERARREGVLWTPFIDQLCRSTEFHIRSGYPNLHPAHVKDISDRQLAIARWVRERRRSKALAALGVFESIAFRETVLAEGPHCVELLTALVGTDWFLLAQLDDCTEWSRESVEWFARIHADNAKDMGEDVLSNTVGILANWAEHLSTTTDGCLLLTRCIDSIATADPSWFEVLDALEVIEARLVEFLDLVPVTSKAQVAALLGSSRERLRECGLRQLTKIS